MRGTQRESFYVEGATVIECKHPNEVVEILIEGNKNRKVGSHELNKDSSRSHSIFTIYVIAESLSDEGHVIKKYGKVSLVDLAGSERLKDSKSQGEMLKETGSINKSLFMLGKVISLLTEKKEVNSANKKTHIPYRDSKLTMLLSDSLGGKAKTILIACVSPSSNYADETLSTINYASRAMNIENKPIIQVKFFKFEFFFNGDLQALNFINHKLDGRKRSINGKYQARKSDSKKRKRNNENGAYEIFRYEFCCSEFKWKL